MIVGRASEGEGEGGGDKRGLEAKGGGGEEIKEDRK